MLTCESSWSAPGETPRRPDSIHSDVGGILGHPAETAADLKTWLAAIVDSSDDIIISKTLDGIITNWNGGAERALGYSAEEIIGTHISVLMPPGHAEEMEQILNRVSRGERVAPYETKRRRKDGAMIDVSLSVSPVRDASGRIIGASKIGRDITEKKLIEAERQQAGRRKDEFLAMLSHELRTPLAAMKTAVEIATMDRAQDQIDWTLGVIDRQVTHLSRLIDDLLDVSRITHGKIRLRKEHIDASAVWNGAIETLRPLIVRRGLRLTASIRPDLRLEADPTRLEQILVNLLTNAAKFTESGGTISVDARQEGDRVVIAVRDTGIGIVPERLPRIFELFAQAERALTRTEGGLGIGLALVRSLAELHGGDVTATSDGPGKGSEFIVRLPALAPSAAVASG